MSTIEMSCATRSRASRAYIGCLVAALCATAIIAHPRTAHAQKLSSGTCGPNVPGHPCSTGPHSQVIAIPRGGFAAGEYCAGHCSQVNATPDTLHLTLAADGYTITGVRTVSLAVNYVDQRSSCTKIQQVVVRGTMDGHYTDIGHATVPSGGLCNFNPHDVTFTVEPFSQGEIKGCPGKPLDKKLDMAYRHKPIVGGLSDADAPAESEWVTAVITCVHGAQAIAVKDSCNDAVWPNHIAPKGHLLVSVNPLPAPTDAAVNIMVATKNARTGAPVSGTAFIMTAGHPTQSHLTNQTFSAFLWKAQMHGNAAAHSGNNQSIQYTRGHVTATAPGFCSAASSN